MNLGIVIAGLGWSATPASAAGTSTGSIYTSVNPAHAGQDVTFNVVVEGNFQSPVGLVQLFELSRQRPLPVRQVRQRSG